MKNINLPRTSSTHAVPRKIIKHSSSYPSVYIKVSASSTVTPAMHSPKLEDLRAEDAKEADYEIAWAAYKRIEPKYSRTNRLLADM